MAETAAYAIKTADHRRDVLSAIGDMSSSYCLRRWYVDDLPELPDAATWCQLRHCLERQQTFGEAKVFERWDAQVASSSPS